ncbi:Uu.00g144340.m01.CDS01 [Anthostomella pinea]|uniref:Uu.00g144340.m01.CDS01 n=1 Tax=Anthostomella pinea TaxID=933095 RepID=A0AAI8YLM5_9PEZI|nr:Uu.00g144340.m01.CDS01 [Anthostomella pinea]
MLSEDTPFSNLSDYKILWNDWPYGIDIDITYLVVWTKFEMGSPSEDISSSVRADIEKRRIIWFKNWASLKSVDGIEHFYVMLYEATKDFIDRFTQGDCALAEKLQGHGTIVSDVS